MCAGARGLEALICGLTVGSWGRIRIRSNALRIARPERSRVVAFSCANMQLPAGPACLDRNRAIAAVIAEICRPVGNCVPTAQLLDDLFESFRDLLWRSWKKCASTRLLCQPAKILVALDAGRIVLVSKYHRRMSADGIYRDSSKCIVPSLFWPSDKMTNTRATVSCSWCCSSF